MLRHGAEQRECGRKHERARALLPTRRSGPFSYDCWFAHRSILSPGSRRKAPLLSFSEAGAIRGRPQIPVEHAPDRRRESVGWRRGEGGRSAHGEYAGRMVRSYRNSPTVPAAMVCMTAL